MIDVWEDQPDVEWAVTTLEGAPVLVIQTNGPFLSASFLSGEYKELEVKYAFEAVKQQDGFLLVANGAIERPLLIAPADHIFDLILRAQKTNNVWIFIAQVMVEDDPQSRVWFVQGTVPDSGRKLSRWIVALV